MKPLSREVNGTRNRILGGLPSKDFQRLRRQMKLVELPLGTSLYEPYAPLERVYFPEDGLASLLTRLDRPSIDSRKQTLTLELLSEPLYVDGDFVRLAQVFSNLLNNASKYSPEGSEIALTAEHFGHDVVITVRDNGAGISAEVLPHIFEVFAQSNRSHSLSHGGLGLGLWLSRRLVELHAGNITASSGGLGTGSQFVVRLPVLREASTKAAGSDVVGDRPTENSKFRVLVVDDNVDSAEAIGRLLQLKDMMCAVHLTAPQP